MKGYCIDSLKVINDRIKLFKNYCHYNILPVLLIFSTFLMSEVHLINFYSFEQEISKQLAFYEENSPFWKKITVDVVFIDTFTCH